MGVNWGGVASVCKGTTNSYLEASACIPLQNLLRTLGGKGDKAAMRRALGIVLLLAAEGALAQSREPSEWDDNVPGYSSQAISWLSNAGGQVTCLVIGERGGWSGGNYQSKHPI